ncbi:NAD(P)H-binding protein [Streptomyces hygroscopicus]|uniref:NAD(P)H-binding protein n=1 Tax=Streptomyces hygroscopicus TaxID=1912 RepID=UPI0007842D04|nr:NAD(P)H-binding protein [Streptomyces hygroscopicus]
MIVITAPTGRIGHQVLENLTGGTEAIRVIARAPDRLSAQIRDRVEVVQGSHNDPAVLTKAFTGADAVLWLIPPNPTTEAPMEHYLGFTRPACEAATAQGVQRIVGVSSLGADYGEDAGLLTPAFAMDDLIERTGVAYRSLRMPFFMENLLAQAETIKNQGTFFLANAADRPLRLVATQDIATTATRLLLDDTWTGQDSVPVLSPDALTPTQMARTISEALGKPVTFQQAGMADYKADMLRYGMSDAWAQGLADMARAQNNGIYEAEAASATPSPTTFLHWCQDVLAPAVR